MEKKVSNQQFDEFDKEFKELLNKFFKINIDDNPAFYAWYATKRNNIIIDIEDYPFIQQFRK